MRLFTNLLTAARKPPKTSERLAALPSKGKRASPSAQKAPDNAGPPNVPCVFVGNLSPFVTSRDLHALFKDCGEMKPIDIRCTRGSAEVFHSYNEVDPALLEDSMYYAVVQFLKVHSIVPALNKNGQSLNGRRLLITLETTDLPEVQIIVQGYRDASRLPAAKRKPLKREATLIIDPSGKEEKKDPMKRAYLDLAASFTE